MNYREVFDTVKSHLLTQNKKSKDPCDARYMYHSPDGLKCAIGCLIPDALYITEIEGHAVRASPTVQDLLIRIGIDIKDNNMIKLIDILQTTHDYKGVKEWGDELDKIEKEFFGCDD